MDPKLCEELRLAGWTWQQILDFIIALLSSLAAKTKQMRKVGCTEPCECAVCCLTHALTIAQHQCCILAECEPAPEPAPAPTK